MIDELPLIPILLFSVVIHEIAHGWMALRLGDTTARDAGRLTLNPIPHIDLVGSILVPLFSLFVAGRIFIAWAKPVPVDPRKFSNPRRDDILVSIIGPVSNLVVALVCTLLFIALAGATSVISEPDEMTAQVIVFFMNMFGGGITLNIILAVFNMLPVPPLDGSHVLGALLPTSLARMYRNIGFFGIFLILILMRWEPFAGLFSAIVEIAILPYQSLITFFL